MYNFNKDYLKAVNRLSDYTNLVFGGSLALHITGLVNRQPNDIDVVTDDQELFDSLTNDLFNPPITLPNSTSMFEFSELKECDHESIFIESIQGEKLYRKPLKINGINVCLFKRDKVEYFEINFNNKLIKLQNILDLLKVKSAYSKQINNKNGYNKHSNDLEYIERQMFKATKDIIKSTKVNDIIDDLPF